MMNREKGTSGRNKFLKGDGVKNLQFLVEFMKRTGHNTESLSKAMGYKSRQTVYHWLRNDDVNIGNIYELFDRCGYTIRFSLVPRDEIIEGHAVISMVTQDNETPYDSKLSFLYNAIMRSSYTYDSLAENLGLKSRITIYHWLKEADNCRMSHVYKCAEALDMKLKIEIEPKKTL